MNKKLLLTLSSILLSSLTLFCQGPDKYGYTFLTSNDSLGPTFQWFNIGNKGFPIGGLGDDNFSQAISISGFQYYATSPSKLYIGSNGFISFNPTNIASTPFGFPAIPTSNKPNGFIAPLLCDLSFAGSNNPALAYYYNKGDTICISFSKVPFWLSNSQGYGGENSFQVILNKADNSITFNYKVLKGNPHPSYISNAVSIGIENQSGTDGLQHSRGNIFPTQYYSVKYYYPKNPKPITDIKLNWINNTKSGGEFLELNDTLQPIVNVRNMGNVDVDSSFTLSYSYRDSTSNILQSGTITIDSLQKNKDTTLQLPNFLPPFSGRFYIVSEVSGILKDSISTNDRGSALINVIDTTRYMEALNYASGQQSGVISWIGGGAGVGVYIKPPFYPAKIDVVNFYIPMLGGANGFKWALYDDNARSGLIGNLLDSGSVSSMQVRTNTYFGDTIKQNNIVINSGGVFLSWIMDGDGIMLGTSNTPFTPSSKRTYEVIDGYWAPFRNGESEDFMMHIDVSDPSLTDLSVEWINNPKSEGQFIEMNDSIQPKVNVKNIGYADIDSSFTVVYNYKDSANTIFLTDSNHIDSLSSGMDTTLQPPMFNPPYSGKFSITAKIIGAQKDANTSNDDKSSLVVAIDTFRYMQPLNYATNYSTTLSWFRPNSGAAVHLTPPYYPTRIDVVNFYIQNIGAAKKFKWVLYDDSGVNNSRGKILDSNTVMVNQINRRSYYRDTIKDKSIVLNQGGVYLSWVMYGDGISLGSSIKYPNSRQSFEIVRGLWYPYRNAETEDFMMHINISDPTITGLSSEKLSKNQFQLFPNPSKHSTEIVCDKKQLNVKSLRIYDLNGKQQFPRVKQTANGLRIFKGSMSNGVYIIQIDEMRKKVIFTD